VVALHHFRERCTRRCAVGEHRRASVQVRKLMKSSLVRHTHLPLQKTHRGRCSKH